jgi:hypothetical protein
MLAIRGGLLVTVAIGAAIVPAALATRQVPRAVATQMTVSGEITQLGLERIAVGRVGCAVPPRLEASAGRFVITDPAKISCLNGKLRSVEYSPELATAQTSRAGGGNAPTTVPTPPPSANPPNAKALAYSFIVLFLGGPQPGETTMVTGTIDDLSATTVTVAGLTCSFRAFPTGGVLSGPAMGDNVSLTCTGGQLIRLASVGMIARSA